jgi:hypothetical protein
MVTLHVRNGYSMYRVSWCHYSLGHLAPYNKYTGRTFRLCVGLP